MPNFKHRRRHGAATVEIAVCLPVLALIVFGSIEASNMFFLRQALVQSAYETVKEAVRRDGDVALALRRGQETLAFRKIVGENIQIDPPNVADVDAGVPVTVTVTAPGDANSVFRFGPFRGQQVSASATMVKE